MELKKIRSAGDPELVRKNRGIIDPLVPSIIAVSFQLFATVYLYLAKYQESAVISSASLTIIYAIVTYLLNKK